MHNETLIEIVDNNLSSYSKIETLETSIAKVDDYIRREYYNVLKKSTLHTKIHDNLQIELDKRITTLFNKLLINLVSKRQIIETDTGYIAIGTAGISYRVRHNYYGGMKFNYFPSGRGYNRGTKEYIDTLASYGDLILKYIHKKDKKEIISICTEFARQYKKTGIEMFKDTILLPDQTLNYIKTNYYDAIKHVLETSVYNKLEIKEQKDMLNIELYYNGTYITCFNLSKEIRNNDGYLYIALREQNPQALKVIERVCKQIIKQNKVKRELIDKLEKDLKGYILLDLF